MAISPVIPNCIQVRLLWVYGGQGGVNVLHGQAAGGVVVNQALAETLGGAIKTSFGTTIGPNLATTASLVRIGVRDMRVANSPEFLDTGAAVVGAGTGDMLPPNVALNVTSRTAKSGKSFRGRTYFSGFTEAHSDTNGAADTVASTSALNFMNGIKNAMTASQLTMAVASRPSELVIVTRTTTHTDGTTSTKTLSTTKAKAGGVEPITGLFSRTAAWETQRRRTNGRGSAPTILTAVAQILFE